MNLAEFSSELMKAKCKKLSVRSQHLWEPLIQMIYTHTPNWRVSQLALVVKNPPANVVDIRDAGSIPGSGRSPGGGHGTPLQYSCLENPMGKGAWQGTVHGITKRRAWLKQPGGKESACNAGDLGLIPGSGRSPAEGSSNSLQYSCLENPMDRGAWWTTVHGVTKELDRTYWLNSNHIAQNWMVRKVSDNTQDVNCSEASDEVRMEWGKSFQVTNQFSVAKSEACLYHSRTLVSWWKPIFVRKAHGFINLYIHDRMVIEHHMLENALYIKKKKD